MYLAGECFVRLVMGVAVSCSVLECQQVLHKQLTLMISFKIIRGAMGKVAKIIYVFFSYILLQI